MLLRLPMLTAVAAFALAAPVLAQTAPAEAVKDLWCGTAFSLAARDAPPDPTEEDLALVKQFVEGGAMLIERAEAAHIAAGFTADQMIAIKADLEPVVMEQIGGSGENAQFTIEECSALLDPAAAL